MTPRQSADAPSMTGFSISDYHLGRRISRITIEGIHTVWRDVRVKESDWKTFRKRVPEWRERYLAKRNREIIAVLSDHQRTPTEQFWDTKEKMQEFADILVDCLDGHSRSRMEGYLAEMLRHGLIEPDDLDEFSEELREEILG